jgi:DNA-binding response OmpR family regulator
VAPVPTTRTRVLVIDDDAPIRDLLRMALEDDGYEVATAADGAVGLGRAVAFAPHVILLDLHMPVMDGLSFAATYRRFPVPWVLAPIVVLTAAGDAAARARQLRAAGFIGKPFDLDEVGATIARIRAATAGGPA